MKIGVVSSVLVATQPRDRSLHARARAQLAADIPHPLGRSGPRDDVGLLAVARPFW